MAKITRESLLTLEAYARERTAIRARVMAHKKTRTVHVGAHVTLIFEDELTMRYQVQEMLRVERIFEEAEIRAELDAYNPLIPDGANWKATMMIEYADADERRTMLEKLIGVESQVWIEVAGRARVYAVADEDLERATAEKTASVHFLRFELESETIGALKAGAALAIGVDHPVYRESVSPVAESVRASLAGDLTG